MAEAGDLLLLRQQARHMVDRVDTLFVDSEQHPHYRLVGAAVQWPLEGAERASDRGVDIGKRSRDNPGGEGGGIQLMVGVENKSYIESLARCRRRLFAVQHPQKVRRVTKWRIRLNDRLTLAQPIVRGHQHGNLRGQAETLADVAVMLVVAF